jgi:hypothetical protein
MCGVDFPYLSYLAAQGAPVPTPSYQTQVPEMFWIDEERDIGGALAAAFKRPRTAGAYVEPYRARHVFAVSSFADVMPGASLACGSVIATLRGRRRAAVRQAGAPVLVRRGERVYGRDLGMDGKGSVARH